MYDAAIVFLYLLVTLLLGIFSSRKITTLREFAVSNKNYSDKVMVATLFATVIGGGSTLGIATNVYQYGIIFMIAFYGAALNKILVARYVAPKISSFYEATSIGDIFENHYGKVGRQLAGVFIISVSVACSGQQITALGFILEHFFHISFLASVAISYGIVMIYCATGGIRAVVATDVFQFVIMLAVVPILLVATFGQFDSLVDLWAKIPAAKLNVFENPHIIGKAVTMFFIMTFSALDPSFIHRIIMSKTGEQAAYITRVTGYLSLPIFTVMGALGLMAYAIDPNISPNIALPFLVDTVLPPILKGFAISALLAIFMSTIDSDLHVLGLSVVQDIIIPNKSKPLTEKSKIKLTRTITFFIGILSVLVALYFKNIFDIMIFAFSFWGPTILVPFIFILYKKVFTQAKLIQGIGCGLITVALWNLFFKDITGFDGFIPGVIANSLFFALALKKHTVPFRGEGVLLPA